MHPQPLVAVAADQRALEAGVVASDDANVFNMRCGQVVSFVGTALAGTKMPGSDLRSPPDSISIWIWRNGGGNAPQEAIEGCLRPSFAARSTCVPPAQAIASSVVMPDSIAAAISCVNRPSDAVRADASGMSEMGKRVRALRKTLGLTQVQLAKAVGVAQSAVSDIERGDTSKVMGGTLSALCTALRTNPEWLLNGRGLPAPAVNTTIDEGELLALFRALPAAQRSALLTVARSMQAGTDHEPSAVNPYVRPKRSIPTKA